MEWTDHGTRREHRQLKSRAAGEWRRVPVVPPLTRIIRSHLDEFGTSPDGRVFSGIQPGELASITYRRSWDKARRAALTQPNTHHSLPDAYMTYVMPASPPGSTEVFRPPKSQSGRAQRRRIAQGPRQVHRRPGPVAKRRIEDALCEPEHDAAPSSDDDAD